MLPHVATISTLMELFGCVQSLKDLTGPPSDAGPLIKGEASQSTREITGVAARDGDIQGILRQVKKQLGFACAGLCQKVSPELLCLKLGRAAQIVNARVLHPILAEQHCARLPPDSLLGPLPKRAQKRHDVTSRHWE
jgi:hypothetical protein